MIVVPADTLASRIVRPPQRFGYDDAPHGHAEVLFENVRVPPTSCWAEGRGSRSPRGAWAPGPHPPLHAPDRPAERSLELMCKRSIACVAFGKTAGPADRDAGAHSRGRCKIDMARLLTLKAA